MRILAFLLFVSILSSINASASTQKDKSQNKAHASANSVHSYADFDVSLDSISLRNPTKTKSLAHKPKSTKSSTKIAKKSPKPMLLNALLNTPFEFDLDAWLARLAEIAGSTDGSSFSQGVCGTCLLHSYEIIAEILLYGNNPPIQGGYFFDTARGINPFINFRQRHSLLYDTLNDITEYYVIPASDVGESFGNSVRLSYASGVSLLPQFDWQYVGYGVVPDDVGRLLEGVLASRVGTLYVASIIYYSAGAGIAQHGLVLVRTSAGVRVLATNIINATTQDILRFGRLNTNLTQLENAIADAGGASAQIAALGLVEISGRYALPFANALSFNDCSGDGENRRGNARIPTAATLNQCASGRCNQ